MTIERAMTPDGKRQAELDNITQDLNVRLGERKHALKPPPGLRDDFMAPLKVGEGVVNDVRLLNQDKMALDALYERGQVSQDMYHRQVTELRDRMKKTVDVGAKTVPKIARAQRLRFADVVFPDAIDRSPKAESVKADLRDTFRGQVTTDAWVNRFEGADVNERTVMMSRWGRDFARARGISDGAWSDIRSACLAVAKQNHDGMSESAQDALSALAQSDDVEAAGVMAIHIAAMEAKLM
jgi:hypothetical protein